MSATVAEMSGVTHRIVELLECLREMPANPAPFSGLNSQVTTRTNSLVRPEPEDTQVAFDIRYNCIKILL